MMSGAPQIVVATPASKGIATIRKIIERVQTQDCKNWEHIVIDGRSTGGTVESPGYLCTHLQWVPEKENGVKCTT